MFAGNAMAVDCGQCGNLAATCPNTAALTACVQSCPDHGNYATRCKEEGYITQATCQQVYPQCGNDCRTKCEYFPPVCQNLDHCAKDCGKNVAKDATDCLQYAYIDMTACTKYTSAGACQQAQNTQICVRCDSYPPDCSNIQGCMQTCGKTPNWVIGCYRAGKINKADCVKFAPGCADVS